MTTEVFGEEFYEPIFESEATQQSADTPTVTSSPAVSTKPLKVKKKRSYTDEQKQQMKENLRRGRETAMANRKKKAIGRKLQNNKAKDDEEHKLFLLMKEKHESTPLLKLRDSEATRDYEGDIRGLRDEVSELRGILAERKTRVAAEVSVSGACAAENKISMPSPTPAPTPSPTPAPRYVGTSFAPMW